MGRGHRGCQAPREAICLPPLHRGPHRVDFPHVSEYVTRQWAAYMAPMGCRFPQSIPTREQFLDTWKEMPKALEMGPPVSVANPASSGLRWPLQSWFRYIQSSPSLVDNIGWIRPLTFIVFGGSYPCFSGSWAQLSVGLLNHGTRGHTATYLRAIGMVVCWHKDKATLATILAQCLADLWLVDFGIISSTLF